MRINRSFTIAAFKLIIALFVTLNVNAQIYTNGFEGGGIAGTTSFTGGATGDPGLNIAASAWSTDGVFTTFTGTAPTAPTAMALQPGTATTTTWTLNVPVLAGNSAAITGLQFDYRSTSTSYNYLTVTINGTSVYSGAVLTDAAFHTISLTGLTIIGITGSISVVSVMSGGSHGSASTFRYDNFSLIGNVVASNNPPSFAGGAAQSLTVCENSAASINTLMSVNDIDVGQTETWSVATAPSNGTLSGFSTIGTSTGSTITPGGLIYTPTPGYSGTDAFTVQVSDGFVTATTLVNVTVNPAPASISGLLSVCEGALTSLTDATAGGTWSSSNTAIATIDPSTGRLSGTLAGTTDITYTDGSLGCTTVVTATVATTPSAVTGLTLLCVNATTSLSDAVPGGVWTSDNLSVATISASGIVSGVSGGTANISYTLGTCAAGVAITVNSLPPITGTPNVCAGMMTVLSDTAPGGAWSSGNTAAATVSSSGVVTGIVSGSATIYYTVGACFVSTLVTVAYPVAAITGPSTVCCGSALSLSDATSGGVWSCDNTSVATLSGSGNVTGIAPGVVNISYTFGGCAASTSLTVLATNAGTITGKDSVCMGSVHVITLSDAVTGGVWTSSNIARATVNAVTGVVTGVSTGIDTIKYTVSNSCGTHVAKFVLHVRTAMQCALGFDQVSEAPVGGLKLFPDPNSGIFTIELLADIDEEAFVTITNVVGQKVKEFTTNTNRSIEIRLDRVAGIYLVNVSTLHGRYFAKMIIN